MTAEKDVQVARKKGRGGGTVGQFGPSGGQIKSIFMFAIFLETSSKNVVTIMTEHQKDNFFVLTVLHDRQAPGSILSKKSPFVYVTPI